MARADDLVADYLRLGLLLAEADGSAAASIVRERRIIGDTVEVPNRADDLRDDYDRLGRLLDGTDMATPGAGSGAAAIARERRLMSDVLAAIETPTEVPLVDRLAACRRASGLARPPARRRKSG